jgi:hypothetical protein
MQTHGLEPCAVCGHWQWLERVACERLRTVLPSATWFPFVSYLFVCIEGGRIAERFSKHPLVELRRWIVGRQKCGILRAVCGTCAHGSEKDWLQRSECYRILGCDQRWPKGLLCRTKEGWLFGTTRSTRSLRGVSLSWPFGKSGPHANASAGCEQNIRDRGRCSLPTSVMTCSIQANVNVG